MQTIAENIKEVVWYKSVDDITDDHSYLFDDLEPGQRIGGMFDYEKRTMHVDGATGMGKVPNPMRKVKRTPGRPYPARDTMEFDPAHVYAHELGHALDLVVGSDGHHYAWSKTPAWREAWMTEINLSNTPLSKYAKYDQVEGFAEFARLALFNPDIASKEFPKCWEAWKDIGYA